MHRASRIEILCLTAMSMVFSACAARESNTVQLGEWIASLNEKAGITRSEETVPYFINIDEDSVWFEDVQAAAAWGVISEDHPFDPEKELTREWAAFTLMNLAAMKNDSNDVQIGDIGSSQFPNQVRAAVSSGLFTLDGRGLFHPKDVIGEEEANEKLDEIISYINKRNITQTVSDIVIRDDVDVFEKQPFAFDPAEMKAVWPAGDAPPADSVIRIDDMWYTAESTEEKDGFVTVLLEAADLRQIAESVHLEGHAEADLSEAEFIDDSEQTDGASWHGRPDDIRLMKTQAMTRSFNLMGYKVTIRTTPSGVSADATRTMPHGSVVYASLKLNGIETDYVWDEDEAGLKDGYFRASFNTSEDLGIRSSYSKQLTGDFSQVDPEHFPAALAGFFRERKDVVQSTLTLCTLSVPVAGNPALTLQIALQLKLYASGRIQIALAQSNVIGCEIRGGHMRLIRENSNTSSASIQADAGLSAIAKLALALAGKELMDVSLEAGAKAKMSTILHLYDKDGKRKTAAVDVPLDAASDAASSNPDVLACGDISAHWVLNIGLNSAGTAAGKLGFSASFNVLNESNAPLFSKGKMHIENMQFVSKCTRKDRIMPESADPLLISKRITLNKYAFTVHIGETKQIGITGMPDGYHEDELVFSSSDASVASVSQDGTVSAIAPGSAVIRIATPDDLHEITCNVIVPEETEN